MMEISQRKTLSVHVVFYLVKADISTVNYEFVHIQQKTLT